MLHQKLFVRALWPRPPVWSPDSIRHYERIVYHLAQEKLKKVKCEIESLKETEKQLTALLRDWEIRLKKSGSGQKAPLLGSLVDLAEHSAQRDHNFKRRSFKGKDKK